MAILEGCFAQNVKVNNWKSGWSPLFSIHSTLHVGILSVLSWYCCRRDRCWWDGWDILPYVLNTGINTDNVGFSYVKGEPELKI